MDELVLLVLCRVRLPYISRPENQLMDVKIGSVTGSSLREHAELIVL
jgi:hypothetical protein